MSLGKLNSIDYELLEFANEDFKTGEICINHETYVTSLYYFEQCFEKIIKSYYIFIMKNKNGDIQKLYEKTKDLGHDIDTSTVELLIDVAEFEKELFQRRKNKIFELTGNSIDFYAKEEKLNNIINGYIERLTNLTARKLDKEFIDNIKNYEKFVDDEHQKYTNKQRYVRQIKSKMSKYSYNFVFFSDTSIFLYPCLYKMNETSRYPLNDFEFKNLVYLNKKRAVNLVKNMLRIMISSYKWIRENYNLTTVYSYNT